MAEALICRELQHTAVSLLAHLRIRNHEKHRVRDVQACQLVQS
jgi:hypothetical protein